MDKAQYIQMTLDELFPDPQSPLMHTDPFTLLVAVVLSARCHTQKILKCVVADRALERSIRRALQ